MPFALKDVKLTIVSHLKASSSWEIHGASAMCLHKKRLDWIEAKPNGMYSPPWQSSVGQHFLIDARRCIFLDNVCVCMYWVVSSSTGRNRVQFTRLCSGPLFWGADLRVGTDLRKGGRSSQDWGHICTLLLNACTKLSTCLALNNVKSELWVDHESPLHSAQRTKAVTAAVYLVLLETQQQCQQPVSKHFTSHATKHFTAHHSLQLVTEHFFCNLQLNNECVSQRNTDSNQSRVNQLSVDSNKSLNTVLQLATQHWNVYKQTLKRNRLRSRIISWTWGWSNSS